MKKICLLIILVLFFPSCSKTDENISVNNDVNEKIVKNVEVFSNVNLKDLVDDAINDEKIDTTDIKKYEMSYETNKNEKKLIEINIVDTTSPYIGIFKNYTHVIGNDFTLIERTFCGDNYDRNVKCTLSGQYDLSKEGSYDLKIIGKDSSGNETIKDFTLNVIPKKESSNSSNNTLSLDDIKNINKDNVPLLIDVSKWQGSIDYNKVKESGIEYVMVRIGTQKGIGLDSKVDDFFEENYEKIIKAGLKVGVYYFSYAKTIEEAKEGAKFVLDTLNKRALSLPVAFDWECWEYFNGMNLNFHDLNSIADTFLKEVKNGGYDVILYGSKNYLENVWNLDYDIWLAHYTFNTSYKKDKVMWQFSNKARINGIKGNVDVNFYYGNK